MVLKNFRELEAKMSPARIARSDERIKSALAEMRLAEIRQALDLTQVDLAKTLRVNQGEISKIESRTDMLLSTLASYVKGIGGRLQMAVEFQDGKKIEISQFRGRNPKYTKNSGVPKHGGKTKAQKKKGATSAAADIHTPHSDVTA